MRIIAGSAKGVRLQPPPDRTTRPTLDRVREACFSILGASVEGARFLDLFAGTGANGLEALSRGAAHADFVESSRESRTIIDENILRTRLADRASVHAFHVPAGLGSLAKLSPYDIIYADPPHAFTHVLETLAEISRLDLLRPDGVLVYEHATRNGAPDGADRLTRTRDAAYGETTLSFYRLSDNAAT